MVERTPLLDVFTYALLALGIAVVGFPIYYCLVAATLPVEEAIQVPMTLIPGGMFFDNIRLSIEQGKLLPQLWNSALMAFGITFGKISVSILSAFAIVYFNFRVRMLAFWMIFMTLMLPVEIRIVPTYEVAANFGLLNSYSGLIFPLVASATATFLFRQFFLTLPEELSEASKVDGAGPMQFFWHIVLPLSKTNIAALFVIVFVNSWNQYLWPLLITTEPSMTTVVVGVQQLIPKADQIPEWNVAMAGALVAMLPPILVVVLM